MGYRGAYTSFNHHDPFEDTERRATTGDAMLGSLVSTTTIRSRILKGFFRGRRWNTLIRFNHHDPFEDTESRAQGRRGGRPAVSTTTIRSRILKALTICGSRPLNRRFNHHDPFEDTESTLRRGRWKWAPWFQPPRSVRGY